MDSVQQEELQMALPRIHPLKKTYIDLRRSIVRMDEYLAQFDDEQSNDVDLYMSIYEDLRQLIKKIPKEHK